MPEAIHRFSRLSAVRRPQFVNDLSQVTCGREEIAPELIEALRGVASEGGSAARGQRVCLKAPGDGLEPVGVIEGEDLPRAGADVRAVVLFGELVIANLLCRFRWQGPVRRSRNPLLPVRLSLHACLFAVNTCIIRTTWR